MEPLTDLIRIMPSAYYSEALAPPFFSPLLSL